MFQYKLGLLQLTRKLISSIQNCSYHCSYFARYILSFLSVQITRIAKVLVLNYLFINTFVCSFWPRRIVVYWVGKTSQNDYMYWLSLFIYWFIVSNQSSYTEQSAYTSSNNFSCILKRWKPFYTSYFMKHFTYCFILYLLLCFWDTIIS